MYDPAVLEITEEDLISSAMAGISNVAALSLQSNYPTLPSIPHSVVNGFKNVLAIALATEYSFPEADKVRLLPPFCCSSSTLILSAFEDLSLLLLSSQTTMMDSAFLLAFPPKLYLALIIISPWRVPILNCSWADCWNDVCCSFWRLCAAVRPVIVNI